MNIMTSLKINTIVSDFELNLSSYLKPIYTYPITSGNIGYNVKLALVLGQPTLTNNTAKIILDPLLLSSGTWLITGAYRLTNTTTTNAKIRFEAQSQVGTPVVTTTLFLSSATLTPSTELTFYHNVSFVYVSDGIANLSLIITPAISASTLIYNGQGSINYMYATRIG